jgi:hypothetical protein
MTFQMQWHLHSVRFLADGFLLYEPTKTTKDRKILQEDLKIIETWANHLGMRFNAKNTKNTQNKIQKLYFLNPPPQKNPHLLQKVK